MSATVGTAVAAYLALVFISLVLTVLVVGGLMRVCRAAPMKLPSPRRGGASLLVTECSAESSNGVPTETTLLRPSAS